MAVLNNYNNFKEFVETLARKTFQASVSNKEYGKMGSLMFFIEHRVKGNDVHLQVVGATKVLTL